MHVYFEGDDEPHWTLQDLIDQLRVDNVQWRKDHPLKPVVDEKTDLLYPLDAPTGHFTPTWTEEEAAQPPPITPTPTMPPPPAVDDTVVGGLWLGGPLGYPPRWVLVVAGLLLSLLALVGW